MNHFSMTANLTRHPELRFLLSGTGSVDRDVADNRRYFDMQTQEWTEEVSCFDVAVDGDLGEHGAQSFKMGDRVVMIGRLSQERGEAPDVVAEGFDAAVGGGPSQPNADPIGLVMGLIAAMSLTSLGGAARCGVSTGWTHTSRFRFLAGAGGLEGGWVGGQP